MSLVWWGLSRFGLVWSGWVWWGHARQGMVGYSAKGETVSCPLFGFLAPFFQSDIQNPRNTNPDKKNTH